MNKPVKAVILAAGKGTRMKSALPKVLHRILGKPLLERVMDSVFKTGCVDEAIVITGHMSEEVENFVKTTYEGKFPVTTILQQPQLGTGHAMFMAYDHLKGFNGTVLVLCGDTPLLSVEGLSEFVKKHQESGAALTVMSALFDNPTNYGRIVRDENWHVRKIVEEKDATPEEKEIKEINAGVYCFEWEKIAPAFFEIKNNNAQGEYYLTDVVDWSVKKGYKTAVSTIFNNYEIFGINSRQHLAEATKILSTKTVEKLMDAGVTFVSPETALVSPETQIGADSVVYPGCVFEGVNTFGANCTIGPNTYIGGNVTTADNVKILQSRISNSQIGANSTVGPFAHLRDGVEIAESVRIGNFVEVKKSQIASSTNVSHLSYIGDATLGSHVNIGAGTITANYDPLTKVKSRTILEDGVKIGSNSVLIAPVTVEKDANVAAGSVITKDVPAGSLAIAREKQKVFDGWVEKKLKKD